jgi:hypothetical protein
MPSSRALHARGLVDVAASGWTRPAKGGEAARALAFRSLAGDHAADVTVVGAGLAGRSLALTPRGGPLRGEILPRGGAIMQLPTGCHPMLVDGHAAPDLRAGSGAARPRLLLRRRKCDRAGPRAAARGGDRKG